MFEPLKHMWPSIVGHGWPKAAFLMCLLLFQRKVITFEQCLIRFLAATVIGVTGLSEKLPSSASKREGYRFSTG